MCKNSFASRNEASKQLIETLKLLNSGYEVLDNTRDGENTLQGSPLHIRREVCKYM